MPQYAGVSLFAHCIILSVRREKLGGSFAVGVVTALFPAFKDREKVAIPVLYVPTAAIVMKPRCSYFHSLPFFQDLAGDRSRGGHQHRRDAALAVKESPTKFGGDTQVRNIVTLIAEMPLNRHHDF